MCDTPEVHAEQNAERDYEIVDDYHLGTCILEIIEHSKKFCIIVTPFFKKTRWDNFTRVLKTVSDDKKRVLFVIKKPDENDKYQNTGLKTDEIKEELNGKYKFDLYFVENLHSKIYLNESQVLITSMNLHEFSAKNNHEIGCLIKNPAEVLNVAQNIIFKKILKSEKQEYVPGMWAEWLSKGQFLEFNVGYCVKCKSPIPYREDNPVCNNCDNQIKENTMDSKTGYCLKCGEYSQRISVAKPLCDKCFLIKYPRTRNSYY
jgi:hypothetical protein